MNGVFMNTTEQGNKKEVEKFCTKVNGFLLTHDCVTNMERMADVVCSAEANAQAGPATSLQ